MFSGVELDDYKKRLYEAAARAEIEGRVALGDEGNELAGALTERVLNGNNSPYNEALADNIKVYPGKDGKSISVVVQGEKATVEAHVKAGKKPPEKPFDLGLAREYGTVNEPANPFFYVTVRPRDKSAIQRIEERMLAALKGE